MKQYQELIGLYSLSKTLRFELKPIGKTLDNIERKGIIANDEKRAEEYKKVKTMLDEYHKTFIKMCLRKCKLKTDSDGNYDSLEEYMVYASKTNRNNNDNEILDAIRKNLRSQIVKCFEEGGSYPELFKKEMIQEHLPAFLTDDKDKQTVEHFNKFTTYFKGFYENRKNMYSAEDKSTAIAYRLIHENLPTFIDNMKAFKKIAESSVVDKFEEITKSFELYLNVSNIEEMFRLDYFADTLTQEDIEVYNKVIGGINEYVNLHNQKSERDARLPLLKPLYKMILSDRVKLSWLPEEFTSDEDMINAIKEMHDVLNDILVGDSDNSLRSLLQNIASYETSKIYISNDLGLTDISQQLFGRYDVYTASIKKELRSLAAPTPKEKREPELYEKRIDTLFKSAKSFSLAYLNSLVDSDKKVEDYFAQMGAYDRDGEQRINLFAQLEMAYISASDVLSGKHRNLNQSDEDIEVIKNLMDVYKSIQHFVKPLLGSGDEVEKDNVFDSSLHAVWDALSIVTPLYNKVRNWLTRKPYSTEKIKINFEKKGDLLGGWVDSKTDKSDNGTQYGGYIFRKRNSIGEYNYYLGVSADTKLFRREDEICHEDGMYERFDYYQLKSQTIFGGSYDGNYKQDSDNILQACSKLIEQQGYSTSYKPDTDKGETVISYLKRIKDSNADIYNRILINKECKLHYETMLKNIKNTLRKLNRVPLAIELSKREDLSLEQFFEKVMRLPSKSFSFFPIPKEKMNEAINRENKPLFLFQITNKDLSFADKQEKGLRILDKRGMDNLHTMYFKALMEHANGIYDIGTGEVFFRKKTKGLAEHTTIHKANQPIPTKNTLNPKKDKFFPYDIVKDRRFTCDKFYLHLSVIMNDGKPKKYNVNSDVQDIIRNGGVKHIIGIDRGERHLLYLSLIDLNGNIIKQKTLNDIVNEYNGNTYRTNYKELLALREGDRMEARKNWKKLENIKDLKSGYLSQVVHVISKMMVEYQAIVVLEDLNMGFMRGRQKIERQVYENFERALIEKLNYYVDKQKSHNDAGGVMHAYQLTSKFESFKKLGKQSGCLFYIPAWNTSKMDPVTGFVNMLDTRYENSDKARNFFSRFDSIRYNATKDWFEFELDYNNFNESREKTKGTRTRWTLCTYGTRVKTFRDPEKLNQWANKPVNLTEEFKKVFADAEIDINGNLKESICLLKEKNVLEPLMGLMKLLLQMRNSITNTEVDYMLSPVADDNGHFYDSREQIDGLPDNADANGAYNIARKGLWVMQQIKETESGEKPRLAITNKEWLQFAQQKPYLND